MSLNAYRSKRNFNSTPEPRGAVGPPDHRRFSVQEHRARRPHYDLRLEYQGVLKSWAVPKGVPDRWGVRRLAVQTEDHPVEYLTFEGMIPEGSYGAGTVRVWDAGTYESLAGGPDRDRWSIRLRGRRLSGRYALVRLRPSPRPAPAAAQSQWLLIRTRQALPQGTDPFPARPRPMLASRGERPFSHPDWLFEPKWDGVRALALLRRGHRPDVALLGRTGDPVTERYPEVVGALRRLLQRRRSLREALLDGELVALDHDGRPRFELLQPRIHLRDPDAIRRLSETGAVRFIAFDCLFLNGRSLTDEPIGARQDWLTTAVADHPDVTVSRATAGDGETVFRESLQLGFEGVVAKRADSRYRYGVRSGEWIKLRRADYLDAVIGGWAEGRGARRHTVGAVLLGLYDRAHRLRFIGKAGTGQTDLAFRALSEALNRLEMSSPPFSTRPDVPGNLHWVRPELVAQVRFAEWTGGGKLRAPVLMGWGKESDPASCRFEPDHRPPPEPSTTRSPSGGPKDAVWIGKQGRFRFEGQQIEVSNLDKVLWPELGITKAAMLRYYALVAPFLIPHLKDRPLSLIRFPDGVAAPSFVQRHWTEPAPAYVRQANILSPRRQERITVLVCDNGPALMWLANLANIEFHPWYSRVDPHGLEAAGRPKRDGQLEYPDFVVIDLDPPHPKPQGVSAAAFGQVREVAHWVGERLRGMGLRAYLKTTGRSGLHLYIPVARRYPYRAVRHWARQLGAELAAAHPRHVTMEWTVAQRGHRVFFDYNQNARGKTLVAPYSLRATPAATVSTPVDWDELDHVDPGELTIETVPDRLKRRGDRWAEILKDRQTLPALETAEG